MFVTIIFGQQSVNSGVILKGGVTIPTGDFGEDTNGGAVTGFGGGFSFRIPINSMVSFEWDLIGTLNSMDVDKVELYSGTNVDAGNWINIYGMVGPRIDATITKTTSIFMTGKVGGDYVISPELEFSGSGGTADMESASAFSFAFAVGGGFTFNLFEIGFYYLNGNEPEFESNVNAVAQGVYVSGTQKFEQKISTIFIYMGFRL